MPKNQTSHSFKTTVSHEVEIRYLLYLPKDYDAKATTKWPLMLFLHGAGERGSNLNKVTVHGPPKIVKDQPDFPFVLVSPQCPAGQRWNSEALLALLDQIIETHKIDDRRVCVTGLSMGGFGTWSLAIEHPDRFAAIAPICGGGSMIDILLPAPAKQAALKNLPVWAFHGAKDPIVKLTESERMVEALGSIGNEQVKFTIYPDEGHDSWSATYKNQELYQWLLEQKRGNRKKKH